MEKNIYKPWRKIPDDIKFEDLPPCPLSISDKGSIGNTGEWRTFRPVINKDKCTKCMSCWAYCPEGVIYLDDNDELCIDHTYCKGCLICFHECPVNAIEKVREEI